MEPVFTRIIGYALFLKDFNDEIGMLRVRVIDLQVAEDNYDIIREFIGPFLSL